MPDLNEEFPPAATPEVEAEVIDREPVQLDELNIDHIVEVARTYVVKRRAELLERVHAMEAFLGFVEVDGELATRGAKLERFTGMKV